MLAIHPDLCIDDRWLEVRASCAGGPGGQNVNKVASRIELRFDLAGCDQVAADVKQRLRVLAGRRMTGQGILRVVCGRHRDQGANRAECDERLRRLLLEALEPPPAPRRKRRVPAAARRRRVADKRERGSAKRLRSRVDEE